jgi:hypothetical protein
MKKKVAVLNRDTEEVLVFNGLEPEEAVRNAYLYAQGFRVKEEFPPAEEVVKREGRNIVAGDFVYPAGVL